MAALCGVMLLRDARYEGKSWGVRGNAFYKDQVYAGPGLKKDRLLVGRMVWAEAYLVAQGRMFFDGAQFCLSDHYGLMAYVDAGT